MSRKKPAPSRLPAEAGHNEVTRYIYCVWFQDQLADPSDQDYEWVACIYVDAETAEDAKNWGDHVARSWALRNPDNTFLWSDDVEVATTLDDTFSSGRARPVVTYGHEASDEHLGW